MKVYVAAPYVRRPTAQLVGRRLTEAGHVVTARWLTDGDALGDEWARKDLLDIERADALIFLPHQGIGPNTGGKDVEFGYALARRKLLIVVGVRINIFHYLHDVVVVRDLDEAIAALETHVLVEEARE